MSAWLRARASIDRVIALFLGVGAAPIVAILAGITSLTSRGRPLIRLRRIGQHGRTFYVWKLRTMVAENMDGTSQGESFTVADDYRITALGRTLRHYRLDELPQLINVVCGEMTLIGPRPEAPAYVDLADPIWQEILQARPGIAGPTQVLVADKEAEMVSAAGHADAYRSAVLPLKLALDRWYVRTASPVVDMHVALGVIQRFLRPATRTGLYRLVVSQVPEAAALGPDGRASRGRV